VALVALLRVFCGIFPWTLSYRDFAKNGHIMPLMPLGLSSSKMAHPTATPAARTDCGAAMISRSYTFLRKLALPLRNRSASVRHPSHGVL
jgi:hypothetical protein